MINRLLFCVLVAVAVTAIYPSLLLLAFEILQASQARIVLDEHFAIFFLRGLGIGYVGCYAVKRLAPKRKRK